MQIDDEESSEMASTESYPDGLAQLNAMELGIDSNFSERFL
jgi:hypothetical protein